MDKRSMAEWLNSQDFYELCQQYRHAHDGKPAHDDLLNAAEAFDMLIAHILDHTPS